MDTIKISVSNALITTLMVVVTLVALKIVFNKYKVPGVTDVVNMA